MSYYQGKNAVVTGGASGLGRAFAEGMASQGAGAVMIADLDEARGQQTIEALENLGARAYFRRYDVSQREQVQALAEDARQTLGRIDFAFNNAGVASGGEFFDIAAEDWDWLLAVNLMAVVDGCRAFGRIMREQGGGHLINTGSLAAFGSMPGMTLYNVSKAGVVMLSETLRAELASQHIRVSVICPSFVRTNLMERTRVATARYEGVTRMMLEQNRITPERIAKASLKQIARNKLYVFPTWDAQLVAYTKRFFPNTMIRLIGAFLPVAQRRMDRLGTGRRSE